ncbi:MAG: hypothetical protein ACEPOV_02950 [Hyphomicrobiales bacterium]
MKNKYIDLIDQTFFFPQEEFDLDENNLMFHGIPLMELIQKYGSPLRFTYLPKITTNIARARKWFSDSMKKLNYEGTYNYCYCTKSSHFSFIMDEALKNNVHIETSSAFDINIVERLYERGKIDKDTYILCNGFKRDLYIDNIASLINRRELNVLPILDNFQEANLLSDRIDGEFEVGIRIATEEEPKFEFYTSRLGIGYKNIVPFYLEKIKSNPNIKVKMLHFFCNTGIKDDAYYWNELNKCLKVYSDLKKVCPELDSLNIGGGFPVKNSLSFNFDYSNIVEEIITQISVYCASENIPVPNIFTEFGSFTVGESGGLIYSVLYQKQQNDREKWNMINSSFITTLPDSWAINKRFVMLPINRWDKEYERVLLGGLTCDSDDYYNSEQHLNAIYLPEYSPEETQYIGFFNIGAYQENIGGFGGIQHCLIPNPKHILINRDPQGKLVFEEFSSPQSSESMLNILGY